MKKKVDNLDAIDKHILAILQEDAKITNIQLGKEIGLSPAPTLERVRRLENSGLIKSYHAVVDKEQLGLGVTIFVQVSLASQRINQIQSFIDKINSIREVIECYHITGNGDFLLKILTEDIPAYQQLIMNKLSQIEELGGMQSMIVLSTFKESKVLPIN